MQLTCRVWLDSLNTGNWCRLKHTDSVKKTWVPVTAWPSLHWSPFVRCFIYNNHKIMFMHSYNHVTHSCLKKLKKTNISLTNTHTHTHTNYCISSQCTVIPRLTKIFPAIFWNRLKNVSVDARANIKQQTWTVGPFHERSSVNFGQIFDFSFNKETEASYWRRGDLPWINFENLEEE